MAARATYRRCGRSWWLYTAFTAEQLTDTDPKRHGEDRHHHPAGTHEDDEEGDLLAEAIELGGEMLFFGCATCGREAKEGKEETHRGPPPAGEEGIHGILSVRVTVGDLPVEYESGRVSVRSRNYDRQPG